MEIKKEIRKVMDKNRMLYGKMVAIENDMGFVKTFSAISIACNFFMFIIVIIVLRVKI